MTRRKLGEALDGIVSQHAEPVPAAVEPPAQRGPALTLRRQVFFEPAQWKALKRRAARTTYGHPARVINALVAEWLNGDEGR